MGSQTALRTLRISATGGTRTLGSMIVSNTGGAGSNLRVYNFEVALKKKQGQTLSPSTYFFNYLGGSNSINN